MSILAHIAPRTKLKGARGEHRQQSWRRSPNADGKRSLPIAKTGNGFGATADGFGAGGAVLTTGSCKTRHPPTT
jgi:hypothetical protein